MRVDNGQLVCLRIVLYASIHRLSSQWVNIGRSLSWAQETSFVTFVVTLRRR